ncbi:SDR family NAD(P)-dependent oxidoreductase [Pseudomonas sp. S75]|nr:SDR family NAD(P)-dependent oxidoreductase [Pseudomonas sp. S75]
MLNAQSGAGRKARVYITGLTDGLGHAAAETLLSQGHEVVTHVRSQARMSAVKDLVDQGAPATVGDLSDLARRISEFSRMDAVIHNAGIFPGNQVLVANVVAPYLLEALIQHSQRLIYSSCSVHKGGRASLSGMDWTGRTATGNSPDSKLFVTALSAAVARLWAEV